MLSFFPRGVLDEILNLIESVSEGFPSYSSIAHSLSLSSTHRPDITEILLKRTENRKSWLVGCFGFNGPLRQYFSLYRAVSQREGEREEKGKMRVKMSKQPPPAPTASAVDPCPTVIQIVGRPGTGQIASHPSIHLKLDISFKMTCLLIISLFHFFTRTL